MTTAEILHNIFSDYSREEPPEQKEWFKLYDTVENVLLCELSNADKPKPTKRTNTKLENLELLFERTMHNMFTQVSLNSPYVSVTSAALFDLQQAIRIQRRLDEF